MLLSDIISISSKVTDLDVVLICKKWNSDAFQFTKIEYYGELTIKISADAQFI